MDTVGVVAEALLRAKNVVLVTGAGVSTESGIKDFRSPGGVFSQVQAKYASQYPELYSAPELVFSRSWMTTHPHVSSECVYSMHEELAQAFPGKAHRFAALLQRKGKLRRVYTQNIDGLDAKAGVAEDRVMEVHGSLRHNNIVFYGDMLPSSFESTISLDFPKQPEDQIVDLLLVMGTSLVVYPVAAVPNLCPKDSMRVFVNQDISCLSANTHRFHAPIKIAGQLVSTKHDWSKNSKWEKQEVLAMSIEDFVDRVVEACGWTDDFTAENFPNKPTYCETLVCCEYSDTQCRECARLLCRECAPKHQCDLHDNF